ncbi:hypothetical protein ACFPRL_04895 [Pseudoclavibacter helvolus]
MVLPMCKPVSIRALPTFSMTSRTASAGQTPSDPTGLEASTCPICSSPIDARPLSARARRAARTHSVRWSASILPSSASPGSVRQLRSTEKDRCAKACSCGVGVRLGSPSARKMALTILTKSVGSLLSAR